MKVLYVGDPHATPDSIVEMEQLGEYILNVGEDEQVDQICFLGDQYHTHSVIHLPVMAFWDRLLSRAFKRFGVVALVGNHDKSGVKGQIDNAMMLHRDILVIDRPQVLDGILYVPYVHDPAEFVQICREHPTKTVVCHQTFAGSVFENGFMVPDGVEPNLLPQEIVISGHIHSPQRLGKVWYPGAPRWRSVSDANTERAIWVVEHSEDGGIVSSKSFSTAGPCKPIFALKDSPEQPVQMPAGEATVVVDVFGPPDYVDRRKRELEEAHSGVRVRSFPESQVTVRVRESDGVPVALKKFLGGFQSKNGTSSEALWKLAQERISWLKQ